MLAPTAAVVLAALFFLTQNGKAPSEAPSPPGSGDQTNRAGDQVKAPVKPKHWHGVINIYDDRVKPPEPAAKPAKPAVAKGSKSAAPLDLDAEFKQILQKPPASLEQTLTITTHSPAVSAVALSADGSRAVSCGSDGVCRCLDLRTGAELSRYERKLKGKRFCAAITPDGKYGLVGGEFKTVHVWDTATGKHIWSPSEPEETVRQIDVTADSRQFGFRTDTSVYQYPILGTEGASVTVDRCEFLDFAIHPTANRPLAAFREAPSIYSLYLPTATTPASSQAVKTTDLSKTLIAGLTASEHFMAAQTPGPIIISAVNPDNANLTWQRRTRLRGPAKLRITDDEEFLIGMDSEGFIEFRRLDNSATAITYDTGARFGVANAISGDGRTLAIGHSYGPPSGQIAVYRLSDLPVARSVRFEQLLDRCFYDDDFDQLEAVAARLQADPVKHFPWDSRRTKYGAMVLHLASRPSSLLITKHRRVEGVQKWLNLKHDSLTAKLVQARLFIYAGWEVRGSGFANTVTEQGWQAFNDNIAKAEGILVPIADSKDPPPEVYPPLFIVAMAQSWPRERTKPYIDKLLETAPTLSDAHHSLAVMFLRRWGGEFGESEAYAQFVAEKVGAAAGDAEYAKIALCLRPYFGADEFVRSTNFDMERVHRGVSHIAETMPEDSDILNEGFLLAWRQEDTKVAGWYLDKLEPYDVQWPTTAWKNRNNYAEAKTWALKSLPPSLVYAKDISAAQRVIGAGGSVTVQLVDGKHSIKYCKRVEELPKEPFKLLGVRYDGYIPDETPDFSFLSGLKSLTSITLPPDKSTDATVATLTNLPGLTYFAVRDCPGFTDAALRDIDRFPALVVLALNGTPITDSGLASLKRLSALQNLTLQNTKITDAGLAHLKSLPKLSSVSLSQPGVTDEGVATISQISTLRNLHLTLPDATGKCLQHVAKLPLLSSLSLAIINMTEADLAALHGAKRLTALTLGCIPISDVGLEHLVRLQGLRNLSLNHPSRVTVEQAKKLQAALPKCSISGVKSTPRPSTAKIPETRPTTPKIPESPSAAPVDYTKHRSAAERVIKAGGGVTVRWVNNGNSSIKSCKRLEELPQEPFELESVDYFRSVPDGVSDFSFLSGLKSLGSIRLPDEKSTDATIATLTKLPGLRGLVVLRAPVSPTPRYGIYVGFRNWPLSPSTARLSPTAAWRA